MALSVAERQKVWAHIMRQAGSGMPNVLKADLQAAINATDDWIEANAASYVAALPAAVRNNSNAQQKTMLFCFVAMRRAGLLVVEED